MSTRKLSEKNEKIPGETLAKLAASTALEKKASQPVILDIRQLGGCTDYFVILTAQNPRQALAIAEAIRLSFKNLYGVKAPKIDGLETGSWVLMDYGFLFVHIFLEDARHQYELEKLWAKGLSVPISEPETNAEENPQPSL